MRDERSRVALILIIKKICLDLLIYYDCSTNNEIKGEKKEKRNWISFDRWCSIIKANFTTSPLAIY